jgi:hypothetical protein
MAGSSLLNYISGPSPFGATPANPDPFGIRTPPTPYGLQTVPVPTGPASIFTPNALPGTNILPNTVTSMFPGTNIPTSIATGLNFHSKLDADGFNAWLWNQSGGKSGAPMPAPEPEDTRLVAARARDRAAQANAAVYGSPGVPGGGNPKFYGPNPIVRRVLGGTGPTISYGTPSTGNNGTGTALIKPGLTTTIKSPAQKGRLDANINQFSTGPVAASKANSLTQFTQDFIDQRAKDKAALGQESNFVGRTYDPNGLESDLAQNAKQSALLGRQAVEAAIRRAGRAASISRMVNGGVDSSYLDRSNTDVLTRLLLDQAQKNSALGRDNITYLQGQRSGLLGTRARLGQDYVNNALTPYDRLTALQSNDLGNIGRIGNIEDNYSLYDYVQPDESARRNLGMLSDLEQTKLRYGL